MKSPANEVPPADFATDSTSHSRGSSGRLPCLEMRSRRSTNIDSPSGPETPSRLRRNEVTMISSAIAKVTAARPMARRLTVGWSTSSTQKQAQTKTMNHGSDRGPEPQAADEHRQQQHRRRDVVGVGERRAACTASVSSTRNTRAGRSETDISRRTRREKPRQGGACVRQGLSRPRGVRNVDRL